jgi:hypothetical protein
MGLIGGHIRSVMVIVLDESEVSFLFEYFHTMERTNPEVLALLLRVLSARTLGSYKLLNMKTASI